MPRCAGGGRGALRAEKRLPAKVLSFSACTVLAAQPSPAAGQQHCGVAPKVSQRGRASDAGGGQRTVRAGVRLQRSLCRRPGHAKGSRCSPFLLQDNNMVRWCPGVPHCGRAVRVAGEVHCEPECACGHRFCFACALEPHSPCTCDM